MDVMQLRRNLLMQKTDTSLINWDRTLGDPNPTTVSNTTSPRVMDTNHYYVGIQTTNYYYKPYVKDYSFAKGTISVCSNNNNSYGLGVPVAVQSGETYTLSAIKSSDGITGFGYYDNGWNYVSGTGLAGVLPITITIPNGVAYAVIWFGSNFVNVPATFTNIKFVKV